MDKIRTRWLWAITIVTFSNMVNICLSKSVEVPTPFSKLFTLFCPLAGLLIAFYCAYIKRGSKWLFYEIISFPVVCIITIYFLLFPNSTIARGYYAKTNIYYTFISIPIAIWYVVCAIQLRKANLVWKREHINEVYSERNQLRIQRHWSISFLVIFSLRYIVTLSSFIFSPFSSLEFAVIIFSESLYAYLTYYFCYQKKSVKLLLTLMIISAFIFIFDINLVVHLFAPNKLIITLGTFLFCALHTWFFIRSIALFELNKIMLRNFKEANSIKSLDLG